MLLILCNIFGTIHPFIMKQILDVDFQAVDVEEILVKLVVAYVSIHVFYAFLKNIKNIKFNILMAKFLKDIRIKAFDKLLKFKMKTFEKYNSAQLYTRLVNDVGELFSLFFGVLNVLIDDVLYIVFMVIMMFFADIQLALIGLATIGVIGIVTIKSTNILGKLMQQILRRREITTKELSEFYNKSKLTYLYQLQENNIEKSKYVFGEELKARKRYIAFHHFPYWLIGVLEAVGIYSVLYYALNIKSISIGSVYLILFYIKECRNPLNSICNQLEEIQNCMASYRRIKQILQEKEEDNLTQGKDMDVLKGDIEFQNVSMKYDKETVLKNISFTIKEGNKVTIAGRTGAGKTTLVNVLMKLYNIQSGKILIGNQDISEISNQSLRKNISYISQNPYIFTDNLRNNICLGNQEITDDQIEDIAEKIGAVQLLKRLPNGLDTIIKANELSYGELQMIAFIRAILHKANIYIFDEPTSNIDLKTEKMIQKMIDHISITSTVIIIAHRKSTIANSDEVIYLKDGQIDMILESL